MEPAWDRSTLERWFEARAGEDVAETDLLRAFFPEEPLGAAVGLDLFQKHFLLLRRLWIFDDELRTTSGRRLWIRGIRFTLVEAPPPEHCGWLNQSTGRFCLTQTAPGKTLCPSHEAPHPVQDGMKSYYLDDRNLSGMSEEGVEALMEGFYRWMAGQGTAEEALQVFGLGSEATPGAIKARWRELSLRHHPDRGGDPLVYQKISAAWAALKSWVP